MTKSNYPNKLDTSVEIPTVRDNITEIGSDVLNGLRSAIFNIEKTLGINPQGSAGNTLASRLNNLIDEAGNLKEEALAKSGLLSGPISDKDISHTAAIKESKLKLNFPTNLLQGEISSLDSKIKEFTRALDELNRIILVHINKNAINQHYAQAITVESAEISSLDNALNEYNFSTLQEFIEGFFNSHVNYSGNNISTENNSHSAKQIFYDNALSSNIITSSNVQGAIDDLSNIEGVGLRRSIINLNSNGRIRTGSLTNSFEANSSGKLLVDFSEISFTRSSGKSQIRILFPSSPDVLADIFKFDILEMSQSSVAEDNKEYFISSVGLNLDGTLSYVDIFGGPTGNFSPGTLARIKQNTYQITNVAGLACSARPRAGFSNTPSIQVALPNSATVISSGGRFNELQAGLYENLAVLIDESNEYTIPVYNSAYPYSSLDTIVSTFNRYSVANNLNIFAYKIKVGNCYELAISHNLPDLEADTVQRSIKVVSAATLDASSQLGFSDDLDKIHYGVSGNLLHINGLLIDNIGSPRVYGSGSVSLAQGETKLTSPSLDFISEGIRVGDICVINGSSNSADNGSYTVTSISESEVQLDYTGNLFAGTLGQESSVIFVSSTIPVSELNFINANSLLLVDSFLDESSNLHYHKRMDIDGTINKSNFYLLVKDVSRNFIIEGDEFTLTVDNNGLANLSDTFGNVGRQTFVGTTGEFRIYSPDNLSFITVSAYVPNESLPIFSSGTASLTLYGHLELPDSVLHLSRCVFSPSNGLIIEDISSGLGEIGISDIIDKRESGTIDETIISESFIEKYIQGPRNDLRATGVIYGLELDNLSFSGGEAQFDLSSGVAVTSGIRREISSKLNAKFDYSGGATNNFYIAISPDGCLVMGNELDKTGGTDYAGPYPPEEYLYLYYVDITNSKIIDLRLFVDRLDYKLLTQIIISNSNHFGHFKTLEAGVEYCKIFSKVFQEQATPSILLAPGEHVVNSPIYLDFDISISGVGPQSILTRTQNFTVSSEEAVLFVIGREGAVTGIEHGVTLSNFTYKAITGNFSGLSLAFKPTIKLCHDLAISGNSDSASFRIEGVRFIGASDYTLLKNELIFIGNLISGTPGTFQNLILTNCYFHNYGHDVGSGIGGVIWLNTASSTYNNFIVSLNSRFIDIGTLTASFMNVSGSATISGVIEVNNVSTN